jgi:hypothetical protein
MNHTYGRYDELEMLVFELPLSRLGTESPALNRQSGRPMARLSHVRGDA